MGSESHSQPGQRPELQYGAVRCTIAGNGIGIVQLRPLLADVSAFRGDPGLPVIVRLGRGAGRSPDILLLHYRHARKSACLYQADVASRCGRDSIQGEIGHAQEAMR